MPTPAQAEILRARMAGWRTRKRWEPKPAPTPGSVGVTITSVDAAMLDALDELRQTQGVDRTAFMRAALLAVAIQPPPAPTAYPPSGRTRTTYVRAPSASLADVYRGIFKGIVNRYFYSYLSYLLHFAITERQELTWRVLRLFPVELDAIARQVYEDVAEVNRASPLDARAPRLPDSSLVPSVTRTWGSRKSRKARARSA